MKCFTFWENIKTTSILDSKNYGVILNTCHDTAKRAEWVFSIFSPDSDDGLSLNFHRFVILYISCDTRSVGLGQYCLPKVSNGFNLYIVLKEDHQREDEVVHFVSKPVGLSFYWCTDSIPAIAYFTDYRTLRLPDYNAYKNSVARLVTRTGTRESITPILKDLHWLPIRARINLKFWFWLINVSMVLPLFIFKA